MAPQTFTRASRGRGLLPGILGVPTAGSTNGFPATVTLVGVDVATGYGEVRALGRVPGFDPFTPRVRPVERPQPIAGTARVRGVLCVVEWSRPVASGAACATVRGCEALAGWARPVAVGEHLGQREDEDFLLLALL